jgi:CHAT domain-containing protein
MERNNFPPAAAANDLAAVFGGIRYDMDSTAIAKANEILPESWSGTRGELQFSYVDSTLRGGDWKYLQWSDVEAVALNKLLKNNGLQPSMRRGYAATEESFKTLGNPSPRIIHLATHGFFFPDVRGEGRDLRGGQEEPVFKISEHPMIRAGLVLAGGNHAWKTGKPLKPGMEDGILTAYEISQMNLSNTELVVLSACETGLGDIQGNEGVYGLQRAFKIAGAKYVLISLWQVPDFQTQEMMTAFYTHWLEAKRSIPDAFRAAQQAMKSKYPEPFNWAGFVLVE